MKKFEKPSVMVEVLAVEDVITTSGVECNSDCDNVSEEGGGI